jgi:hypothetical protein
MDGPRVDTIVQTWGCETRRSLMLRLFAGTAVGAAVLGRLGLEDAAAGCVAPGKKCKGKNGKKKKCCGGAKCQGKKCRCPGSNVVICGKNCCKPGQNCLDGTCVNGDLAPGAICDPDRPYACKTGNCQCITLGNMTQCTCRQEACFGHGVPCDNTSQCCTGGCEGFTNTCLPIEA